MNNSPICSGCGSENEPGAAKCINCGDQLIVMPAWATSGSQRNLLRRKRIVLWSSFVIILAAFTWVNYPFLPNPIILIFSTPTSDVSSSWYPGKWPMNGGNLSGSASVPWTGEYPEGVELDSIYVGPSTRSAPVISNGTVYMGGESTVFAINVDTSKTSWESQPTGPVHGTLAVANDTLFVPLRNKEILALDAMSGSRRWSFKAESPFVGSPSVDKGIVYSSTQKGRLYALDAGTGNQIWAMDAGDAITSAVAITDNKIAVGVSTGGLFIRDARTGDNRSRVRIGGLITHPPVVGGKSVYIVSNGTVLSFDVDSRALPWAYPLRLIWTQLSLWQLPVPTPPDPAGFRWHATPMEDGPETSTPVPGSAEMMYVGATPWPEFSTPVAGNAEFITAPAATSDAIYIGSNNNSVYSLSAKDGKMLWKFDASSIPVVQPTVVGERLYFGTSDGTLYSVDRINGQEEWSLELGSPLSAPVTFASGVLYARTEDGRLHQIT